MQFSKVKVKEKEKLVTEEVEISKLKLWKDNPRRNDQSVPKLSKLLEAHGQRSPIVVWKKNMVIYKGNTTFKAAKALGWKTISCILADFPSEQAAIAYGIADNKSSEWAQWDENLLNNFLNNKEVVKTSGFTEVESQILAKLGTVAGEIDANAEWEDMPEFKVNKNSFKSVVVHFADQKSVDEFARLIKQEITPETRYIWHPKQVRSANIKRGFVTK